MLDLAVELEIIEKSGSWYSYNDERIGQGRENAKTFSRRSAGNVPKSKTRCGWPMA